MHKDLLSKSVSSFLVILLALFTSCRTPGVQQSHNPQLNLVLPGLLAQELINAPIYWGERTPTWNILIKTTSLSAGTSPITVSDISFKFSHALFRSYIRIDIDYEYLKSGPKIFSHFTYLDSPLVKKLSIKNVNELQDFLDQSVGLLVASVKSEGGLATP